MKGDAQVPLLRIVPVEGRDGEMITRVFDPIQYCPLLQRRFQTVDIDIRDDTGSIVPFLRFDRQVVNADYDNRVQDEYLTQKYDLQTWSLLSTSHPRRYTVRVTRCHSQD
jgi:hypothetical protein